MTTRDDVNELRVLILAPVGRDAALTSDVLGGASLPRHVCANLAEMCREIERGAGAVLLTEEALDDHQLPEVAATLEAQPAWSDISVLLFAGSDRSQASLRTLRMLEVLRNVTLLDRPVRVAAVVSTVRAALRGRRRQYELRDVLVELHAARSEAERANGLKDEVLATLSHELRTPLTAVLGWATALRAVHSPTPELEQGLETIERNARVQAQIIEDLLDMSRIISGKVRLDVQRLDLPAVVAEAINTVRTSASAKGVRLQTIIDPLNAPVTGDPHRLQQVFWNLLSNAIKFTPKGGRIQVLLERVDSHVEVSIIDTGEGISPEFLPYIFNRFQQADPSTTRRHGGLGLGLAIVKELVELHGGSVRVKGGGTGKGATFIVSLPLTVLHPLQEPWEREHPQSKPRDVPLHPAISLNNVSVLVIDDELD